MKMRVGVLALQGAFIEHQKSLAECGCEPVQIRKKEELASIHGLVIPGGESTTIGKLLVDFELMDPVIKMARAGKPIFGTCAGLIVMSKEIENSAQHRLGLMDITVRRNAFGRQVDSFETELSIPEIGPEPFKAVFIRAPYIYKTGSDVQVLATYEGKTVFARQGNLLVSSFHPELTPDIRIHQYFISLIKESQK